MPDMRIKTISNLRFICIFAMLFAHVSVAESMIVVDHGPPYLNDSRPFSLIILIFIDGFGRISSPLLGFLSGYFVSANLRHRPYLTIVAGRLRTLYLPVVVWSSIYAGAKLVGAYVVSDTEFSSRVLGELDFNSFLGVTYWPYNFPLHYLIDLFKCILFLPVLLYLLDRFGISVFLALIGGVFIALAANDLNHFNPGVNRDSILPRADLFLFFCAGVLAQRRRDSDIVGTLSRVSIRHGGVLIALGLAFFVCAGHWRWLVAMEGRLAIWSGFILLMATRMLGCLLIVAALRWIGNPGRRNLVIDDKLTFHLFCTHLISISALKGLLTVASGGELSEAYRVAAFLLSPLFALCVALALYKIEMALRG